MSTPYRREISYSFGGPLTRAVKAIILVNLVAYAIQSFVSPFTEWLALRPLDVLPWNFQLWRIGTYMFLHAGIGHLFFNMLILYFFGNTLERRWGTRSFVKYYFVCGLGAALFCFVPGLANYSAYTYGASGAIYGVMLAYAILFPYQKIYVLLTFPVEIRYVVFFLAFLSIVSLGASDGVSHLAHLGGLVTGYVVLRWFAFTPQLSAVSSRSFVGFVTKGYQQWKVKRLRKKFESYYEKRTGRGNDPNTRH